VGTGIVAPVVCDKRDLMEGKTDAACVAQHAVMGEALFKEGQGAGRITLVSGHLPEVTENDRQSCGVATGSLQGLTLLAEHRRACEVALQPCDNGEVAERHCRVMAIAEFPP